jgi:hypothetical protein
MQPMRLVYFLSFLFIASLCVGQTKGPVGKSGYLHYFDRLLNDTLHDPADPKLINYPTIAYSPETRWEFGVSSLYIYSAKNDLSNRLSELKAFTFYTLENQYGLWLDHAVYTDENLWFIYGKVRYQSFPLFYYGVGPGSPKEYSALIDGNYTLVKERFLRAVVPSLYVGLELDYQRLGNVSYQNTAMNFEAPEIGPNGSSNLGLGVGILYDNIHNAMNPRKGVYSEWAFLNYSEVFGSDFSFTSYITDNRVYRPMGKNRVVAGQVYGQFTSGEAPFNMLALMGGESLMRGYYLGRYRDQNLVAAQLEYRILPFSFSKKWGASAFIATGQVYGSSTSFSWDAMLPTAGAGLRYLIFPEKDIYTRIDLAFTREGSGVYFFIGEAF